MKLLITGAEGQLGYDVKREAESRGITCICPTHSEMDITVSEHVNSIMEKNKPDAVIHCEAGRLLTLPKMRKILVRFGKSMQVVLRILQGHVDSFTVRCCTYPLTMFLMGKEQLHGMLTASLTVN